MRLAVGRVSLVAGALVRTVTSFGEQHRPPLSSQQRKLPPRCEGRGILLGSIPRAPTGSSRARAHIPSPPSSRGDLALPSTVRRLRLLLSQRNRSAVDLVLVETQLNPRCGEHGYFIIHGLRVRIPSRRLANGGCVAQLGEQWRDKPCSTWFSGSTTSCVTRCVGKGYFSLLMRGTRFDSWRRLPRRCGVTDSILTFPLSAWFSSHA